MKRKVLSIFLICIIIISIIPVPVYCSTVEDLVDDLDKTEQEKEDTQNLIDANKASIEELMNEIKKLDNQIMDIEKEIKSIQKDIDATEVRLEIVEEELQEAIKNKDEHKALLDERISIMYMYGDSGYLEILFSAKSFGDLVTRLDMIKTIIKYDQEVFDELQGIEKTINEKKQKIVEEKQKLDELKDQQQSKKNSLQKSKKTKQIYIDELEKDKKRLEEKYKKLENESDEIKRQISQLQNIDEKLNSIYRWPVPRYSRISSPYGWRTHPILGYKKFHSGIDISTGGRRGMDCIAVGFGEVIQSKYSSGYGNKIVIDLGLDDKGNRVSAVYAHLAKRYLSVGDRVIPGDKVGEVGTTGLSTGIHLHFEIRINGSTRNPLDYVSP